MFHFLSTYKEFSLLMDWENVAVNFGKNWGAEKLTSWSFKSKIFSYYASYNEPNVNLIRNSTSTTLRLCSQVIKSCHKLLSFQTSKWVTTKPPFPSAIEQSETDRWDDKDSVSQASLWEGDQEPISRPPAFPAHHDKITDLGQGCPLSGVKETCGLNQWPLELPLIPEKWWYPLESQHIPTCNEGELHNADMAELLPLISGMEE